MKLQLTLLIATSFLAATSFNAVAAKTKCSLATLKGTYQWTSQTSQDASAGRDYFDGNGGVVSQSSSNSSTDITTTTNAYTVNEDCTGTQVGNGETYNNFISPDGNSIYWVETDGSTISSGIETRVSRANLLEPRVCSANSRC